MKKEELIQKFKDKKRFDLVASILIDMLGMSTFLLPALGESFDIILAPIISALIYAVHRTTFGAALGFIEEIIPFTDIIPTATILWAYRYLFKAENTLQEFSKKYTKENNFSQQTVKLT